MEQHNEIDYKRPFFDGENHNVIMEDGKTVVLEPFQDFSNLVFVKCDFSRLSLTSCNFSGCQFIDCQMEYTEFSHSDLSRAVFINSICIQEMLYGQLRYVRIKHQELNI